MCTLGVGPLGTWPSAGPYAVHKTPCSACPSAHWAPDPEAQEYLDALACGELALSDVPVFPCGWRPEKLCAGWVRAIVAAAETASGRVT